MTVLKGNTKDKLKGGTADDALQQGCDSFISFRLNQSKGPLAGSAAFTLFSSLLFINDDLMSWSDLKPKCFH